MTNSNQYRYRHGQLNPHHTDEDTFEKDDPTLERGLDRLHKKIKPASAKNPDRKNFVGHVVGVVNNLNIEDISAAQRAELMGNPKKIKVFIVRIPESFSAAIPESINVGSRKKKLDDIYSQLEKEITFIMRNPDHPSPGIGDLVRCDFLVKDQPQQGGIITEILGKQGNRTNNILAKISGPTASEAVNADGQVATPANNEQNKVTSSPTLKEEIDLLIDPFRTATDTLTASTVFPAPLRKGYIVNTFAEFIIFRIHQLLQDRFKVSGKSKKQVQAEQGYSYIIELYNPKKGGSLPLSYYADFAWLSEKEKNNDTNSFLRKIESAGIVHGLVKDYDFDRVSVKASLRRGDIVNRWSKSEGKWVNSTAVIGEFIEGNKYNVIGQNMGENVVTEYELEIKNTEKEKFSVCRIRGNYERK